MPYAAGTSSRPTNYEAALAAARDAFSRVDVRLQTARLGGTVGADRDGSAALAFTCMGTTCRVVFPSCTVSRGDGQPVTVFSEILILHALLLHPGRPPRGEWIGFSDIPDGLLYDSVYKKRTGERLARALSISPGRLGPAAERLGGRRAALGGDASAVVEAFPGVPVGIVFWEPDDRFAAAVTFLYDRTITEIFPTEDIVVLTQWVTEEMIRVLGEAAP
jgi:hypothetical protein